VPLDPRDHQLSMRISPRARDADNNLDLRTLIVHRLSDTEKAVGRISLRGGSFAVFCEPCKQWTRQGAISLTEEFLCPRCGRLYEIEFAVLEEVNNDPPSDPTVFSG
jgi:hypothetical protein